MSARLKSLLSYLFSTQRDNKDYFESAPNEIINSIACNLDNRSKACFAMTSQRIHAVVEQSPSCLEISIKDQTRKVSTVKVLETYSKIRRHLNECNVIQRKCREKEPWKLLNHLNSNFSNPELTMAAFIIVASLASSYGGKWFVNPAFGSAGFSIGCFASFYFIAKHNQEMAELNTLEVELNDLNKSFLRNSLR